MLLTLARIGGSALGGAPVIIRCDKCGTPIAAVQNGCLVIEARHHGEKHVNAVSIWNLVLMALRQVSEDNDRTAISKHKGKET